jgi:hypothetical protein
LAIIAGHHHAQPPADPDGFIEILGLLHLVLEKQLRQTVGVKRRLARQQVIQRAAQRIDVTACVGRVAVQRLLRRQIVRRANDRPGLRGTVIGPPLRRPRQTHIQDLDRQLALPLVINRLCGLTSRCTIPCRACCNPTPPAGPARGQRRRQRSLVLDQRRQVGALDVLHRQEVSAGCGLSGIVGDDDAGAGVWLRPGPHGKAFDGVGVSEAFLANEFEGDDAVHGAVAGLEDLTHAALAQLLQDLIRSQFDAPRVRRRPG